MKSESISAQSVEALNVRHGRHFPQKVSKREEHAEYQPFLLVEGVSHGPKRPIPLPIEKAAALAVVNIHIVQHG
jgi:hypothetical protein